MDEPTLSCSRCVAHSSAQNAARASKSITPPTANARLAQRDSSTRKLRCPTRPGREASTDRRFSLRFTPLANIRRSEATALEEVNPQRSGRYMTQLRTNQGQL